MELTLGRDYHPQGVNGVLLQGEGAICCTIELPWNNNLVAGSCIPEGRYPLAFRFSQKFGHHLLVQDVPGRSLILIHPANIATKELKGCIAPVTRLTGPGIGEGSRAAMRWLMEVAKTTLYNDDPIFLTIKKSPV